MAKAVYLNFKGDVRAKVTGTTFSSNYGTAPYALCIHWTGLIEMAHAPRVSVRQSIGLDPSAPSRNRTAPWWAPAGLGVQVGRQRV